MLSKRVAVCLYRSINRQISVTQKCCGCVTWRNLFVRSRSNTTDGQTIDVNNCKIGQESVKQDTKLISTIVSSEPNLRLNTDEEFFDTDKVENTPSMSISNLVNTSDLRHHQDDESSTTLYSDDKEITGLVFDEEGSVEPLTSKKEYKPVYNVAPYVKESTTLTYLVNLGVSLAEVEKKKDVINAIIKMDFNKDIQPIMLFLAQIGVGIESIGIVITKNPYLLIEDLDNLQARINYLQSKKFPLDSISSIVTRNPNMLSMKVERVDAKLGFLQKEFFLQGNEVRQSVTKCPRLITTRKEKIEEKKLYMLDNLGFTRSELKKIYVTSPKSFLTGEKKMGSNFDFLHNIMGLSHKDIILWPQIFQTRPFIIRQRHQYLLSLGRAQYDPKKENYISLRDVVRGSDEEFCENLAKSSVQQFNDFIKTM